MLAALLTNLEGRKRSGVVRLALTGERGSWYEQRIFDWPVGEIPPPISVPELQGADLKQLVRMATSARTDAEHANDVRTLQRITARRSHDDDDEDVLILLS